MAGRQGKLRSWCFQAPGLLSSPTLRKGVVNTTWFDIPRSWFPQLFFFLSIFPRQHVAVSWRLRAQGRLYICLFVLGMDSPKRPTVGGVYTRMSATVSIWTVKTPNILRWFTNRVKVSPKTMHMSTNPFPGEDTSVLGRPLKSRRYRPGTSWIRDIRENTSDVPNRGI